MGRTGANCGKLEQTGEGFSHRTEITKIRATYVHDNLDSTHGTLHHRCYLCLWEQVMAHSGRHVTNICHVMTDSGNIPPNA